MKQCPYCSEEIQDTARKCKHCGEWLDLNAEPTSNRLDKWIGENCPDGTCIGYIQRNGRCSVCGLSVSEAIRTEEEGNNRTEIVQGDAAIICPHCHVRGKVTTQTVKMKRGISGGKATAAILTVGVSLLATGLARKEKTTKATCHNCGAVWYF